MYGLRGMSNAHYDMRKLLEALMPKFRECPDKLGAQHVCNAIYGMQSMTSKRGMTKEIVEFLTDKTAACTQLFDKQNVGNALYGLKGMWRHKPGRWTQQRYCAWHCCI